MSLFIYPKHLATQNNLYIIKNERAHVGTYQAIDAQSVEKALPILQKSRHSGSPIAAHRLTGHYIKNQSIFTDICKITPLNFTMISGLIGSICSALWIIVQLATSTVIFQSLLMILLFALLVIMLAIFIVSLTKIILKNNHKNQEIRENNIKEAVNHLQDLQAFKGIISHTGQLQTDKTFSITSSPREKNIFIPYSPQSSGSDASTPLYYIEIPRQKSSFGHRSSLLFPYNRNRYNSPPSLTSSLLMNGESHRIMPAPVAEAEAAPVPAPVAEAEAEAEAAPVPAPVAVVEAAPVPVEKVDSTTIDMILPDPLSTRQAVIPTHRIPPRPTSRTIYIAQQYSLAMRTGHLPAIPALPPMQLPKLQIEYCRPAYRIRQERSMLPNLSVLEEPLPIESHAITPPDLSLTSTHNLLIQHLEYLSSLKPLIINGRWKNTMQSIYTGYLHTHIILRVIQDMREILPTLKDDHSFSTNIDKQLKKLPILVIGKHLEVIHALYYQIMQYMIHILAVTVNHEHSEDPSCTWECINIDRHMRSCYLELDITHNLVSHNIVPLLPASAAAVLATTGAHLHATLLQGISGLKASLSDIKKEWEDCPSNTNPAVNLSSLVSDDIEENKNQ